MAYQWVYLANLMGATGVWIRTPLANASNLDAVVTVGAYPVTSFAGAGSMTPALPAIGSGVLEVLPTGTNLIQRWTTIDNPHQIWARNRNAGTWSVWKLQSWERPAPAAGTDFNTIKTPGDYPIWAGTGANNPTGSAGRLTVSPQLFQNGSWTYHTQTWQSFEVVPRLFVRSTSATAWSPWREVGAAVSTDTVAALLSAPDVLQRVATDRRGGVRGTGGKALVVLRFDHGLNNYKAIIKPLLRLRNLIAAIALNSGVYTTANSTAESNNTTFTEVQDWCVNDGDEIWNHGETHRDAATSAGLKTELVDSLTALRSALPKLAIEGFLMPGVGGTEFAGLNSIQDPATLYSTEAGRLLMGSHAFISGLRPGQVKPLNGKITPGWSYRNMDTIAGVDAAIALVADAQASGGGVVLMMHPSLLNSGGSATTTAKLTELLDFLVVERDAGRIDIATHTGFEIADFSSTYRNNILRPITPAASVSQTVDLATKYAHLRGAVRKLVATVTVTATASVTVALTDATTGLNATRTYAGLAAGTYELFQHGTLPLTATTATASATVDSGTASITALKLINA
ncbi:hypothetical protein ACIPY3_02685 [Paenarthrobacter sp. NPDC089714]|uniref:hypothetical protein n=1 Tax=Paenarthrobacter sp. NPDC089714 TaxID=3364377 RepID=UPI0038246499